MANGKAAASPAQPIEVEIGIPEQSAFYKLPARFGAIPLDEAPLGYEVETKRRETKVTKFEHAYPRIYLPFQEVQRVAFGHGKKFEPTELFPTGANRLFFGDNLHIMRQLPSKSIDLEYIDPPFFSGRNYNVIFGDKNEVRSFSDIWEGGMPGYLVWLNARLIDAPDAGRTVATESKLSQPELVDLVKHTVRDIASALLADEGIGSHELGYFYGVLMDHVRAKLLGGATVGSASAELLTHGRDG